jgi:hypothetical protein
VDDDDEEEEGRREPLTADDEAPFAAAIAALSDNCENGICVSPTPNSASVRASIECGTCMFPTPPPPLCCAGCKSAGAGEGRGGGARGEVRWAML